MTPRAIDLLAWHLIRRRNGVEPGYRYLRRKVSALLESAPDHLLRGRVWAIGREWAGNGWGVCLY